MDFTSEYSARAYITEQIARFTIDLAGQFATQIRVQWNYRQIPLEETDLGHLEWKIYRPVEDGDFVYWTMSVTSDLRWFVFTHGNSDYGPRIPPEMYLVRATILGAGQVSEAGDTSLASYLAYVVSHTRPNRYGLT